MYASSTNQRPPVQVRIEKPIYVDGKAVAPGDIISMSHGAARELEMLKKVTILSPTNTRRFRS